MIRGRLGSRVWICGVCVRWGRSVARSSFAGGTELFAYTRARSSSSLVVPAYAYTPHDIPSNSSRLSSPSGLHSNIRRCRPRSSLRHLLRLARFAHVRTSPRELCSSALFLSCLPSSARSFVSCPTIPHFILSIARGIVVRSCPSINSLPP